MVSSTFVASRQSCRGNSGLWIIEGPRLLSIDEQTGLVTRDVRLPPEHGTALSLCSTGNGPQAHIWVGFSSGTIAILETSPTLRVVSESVLHEGSVTGLQWVREASPTKEDVVVSIATDGRAALWSTSTWECISCVWVSHATLTALSTVFVSPGRLQMVVGTASGNIHSLCPFQQEEAMLVPGAHAGEVRQIVVHAQGDDINSDVARLWTVGTDGSLCVWEASRHRVGTHRSFFRVLSKTPLIQLDAIAGHSILSLEVSRDCPNQILCVLAEGEHFAAVDMTTGSVITMWSIDAPIGDPVLLSPHFRKGWSVLDGKCHDVPTPFVVPSTPVAPPLSSLVVTTGVSDASLDRSLKDARLENQRLREQIQVLLRSPLQRSSSVDHQESNLVHMRSCYASALTVLDNMEHATREFILNLEGEIRSDATSWMQYAQRGSVNTESARHLHAALQELHDERENVSRLSHELTELRLKFSSAQQREDVAVMEAAALKRQCSQDREHIMLLERNMTERDAQLIEATRECKTLRDTEAALRQQLDNSEKLLRESSQESDQAVSFIQQLLDDERALTSKLRAEASSVNERTATLREQLAAAVASESNTLQRVTALQDEMERRQLESMTHIGEEHRGAVSKLQDEITKRKLKEESLEQLIAMLREESALHAQDAAARRDKLSRQQRAISETSAAMIDALHDEIHALREQNSDIAAAKLSIESERDSLLDQVQSQRHLVKEELSRMEAEVINLQRHAKDETVISELAITQRKIAVLETELQVSQNEVEALQQLFKRQRTALEDKILHQASDIESRNEREAELKGRAQLAERKVRELEQAHEDTAQSHASELQRVKLQIAAIRDRSDHRQSDELAMQDKLDAAALQHKRDIAALKEEFASLQVASDEESRRLHSTHRAALAERARLVEELQDELAAKQRELDRVIHQKTIAQQRALDDLILEKKSMEQSLEQARGTAAALQETLNAKEAELHQSQLKRVEEQSAAAAALRHERLSHEEASAAMEEKLHKIKREFKQQAAEHISVLSSVEAASADIKRASHHATAALQTRLDHAEREVVEANERESHLKRELAETRETISDINMSFEMKLQVERRSCAKQINELKEVVAREKNDAELAKEELERALKACRSLSNEKELHQTEAEDLQIQLHHATDKLNSTLQELDSLRQQMKPLAAKAEERDELERQRDNVELAHANLTSDAQQLARDKRHLEYEVSALREQCAEAREINAILRQAVEDEKEAVLRKDTEISRCKKSYDALCASNAQQQHELANLQDQHRIVVTNLHAYELAQRDKDASRRWQPPTPSRVDPMVQKSTRIVSETAVIDQWVKTATSSRSPSSVSRVPSLQRNQPIDLQHYQKSS